MKLPLIATLPLLLLWAGPSSGQRSSNNNIEASKMHEAGPLVTGGTGTTAGPNSRNQAVSPMPGTTEEELSERPPILSLPLPPKGSGAAAAPREKEAMRSQ